MGIAHLRRPSIKQHGRALRAHHTEYMQVFAVVATSFTICGRARHEHKWVARGNCQLVNATARWICRILHGHLSRLVEIYHRLDISYFIGAPSSIDIRQGHDGSTCINVASTP